MTFQPEVNQELIIDGVTYRIAEHPVAPGMPYGQEGRQATVYKLAAGDDYRALKVFKPRYRAPSPVGLADRLAPFADLAGLQVCSRTVLSTRRHRDLLQQYPDLTYAVLMPWIDGPTWTEVLASKRELSTEQSLNLARSLAGVLVSMEERGLAHCDLSGANVLIPALSQSGGSDYRSAIELVDIEQLLGPGLDSPAALLAGSPGYAHETASSGLCSPNADRFAGAVLIAEMLGWCDERVRNASWGESYFEPSEMQQEGERYRLLAGMLGERWGSSVAGLFGRAWRSEAMADCATFGDWLVALPETATAKTSATGKDGGISKTARLLLASARRLEAAGDLVGALAAYEQVLDKAPAKSGLYEEVSLIVAQIRKTLSSQAEIDRKAGEARKHEQAGRWQSAATFYEELLEEESLSPNQRKTCEDGLRRCREEIELGELFDTATQMMAQQRWGAAKELLTEVLRRGGNYQRNGQQASALLAEVERHLQGDRPPSPPRQWIWVLVGGAFFSFVLAVVAFGADPGGVFARFVATATSSATASPTATPTFSPTPALTASPTSSLSPTPSSTSSPTLTPSPVTPTSTRVPPTTTPTPFVRREFVQPGAQGRPQLVREWSDGSFTWVTAEYLEPDAQGRVWLIRQWSDGASTRVTVTPTATPRPTPTATPTPRGPRVFFTLTNGIPWGYFEDRNGNRSSPRSGSERHSEGPNAQIWADVKVGDTIILETDLLQFSAFFDCGSPYSPKDFAPCDFNADSRSNLPSGIRVTSGSSGIGRLYIARPNNWDDPTWGNPQLRFVGQPFLEIRFWPGY